MTTIQNWLVGIGVLALLVFASVMYGKHLVQVEWDKDKAVRQSLLDREVNQNKEALDALKSQYETDKTAATSKAGRDAVARYIRERGLLPACAQLPSQGHVPAQSSEGDDAATGQPGTGDSLTEFVAGCGQDALKVMRWQELCTRMNCEIY